MKMGNHEILDSMIVDGPGAHSSSATAGTAGEVIAAEYHIGRAAQDEFAVQSLQGGRGAGRRPVQGRDAAGCGSAKEG